MKSRSNSVSLVLLFCFGLTTSIVCAADEEVGSIELPLYPQSTQSATFKYSYRYHVGNPQLPVIVYMPGGPGYPSIDELSQRAHLPDGFGFVATDQRGTGRNVPPSGDFPVDAWKSDYLAADVVALIEKLDLKNYILYGHSFGTLHATQVAAEIQKRKFSGLAQPRAVVLEGVIGRSFKEGETFSAFQQEFEELKMPGGSFPYFNEKALSIFDGPSLPFGTEEQWGTFIFSQLMSGRFKNGQAKDVAAMINGMIETPADYEFVKQAILKTEPLDFFDIFKQINCREFMPDYPRHVYLRGGALVTTQPTLCDGIEMKSPFDSATLKTEAPIYYFSGTNDPATPLWQARYHFEGQDSSESRTFVSLSGAGHSSLRFNLYLCRNEIWNAIAEKGDLKAALSRCAPDAKIEQRSSSL